MRALVWFRSDLRVADNTALESACRAADEGVIAVFVICPRQWRDHDWADIRVDFVLRNLEALSRRLAALGIPLLVRTTPGFSGVPGVLEDLAERHGCGALYFNREYEVNEKRRDEAVQARFEKSRRTVHPCHDQVVLPPGSVLTGSDDWYKVFTPFKKAWLQRLRDSGGPPRPRPAPRKRGEAGIEADEIPRRVDGFDREARWAGLWPAGEAHAKKRLSAFTAGRIAAYARCRDRPDTEGTSALSPYLASGVISPRACLAAAVEANHGRLVQGNGRNGPSVWISELIWREFYKHLLVGFPRLSMNQPFKRETARLEWSRSRKDFRAWCDGRTGYPIVDAAMRQLNETGWMHNRLRMITAMFLTKDLFIDWRWGERYFMQRLVDGDLAANNGGWQWSASTGTDAAPYFRIYNPTEQGRRHDPDARFIKAWLPELAELPPRDAHDPPSDERRRLGYPGPVCDHAAARTRAIAAFKALR